MPIIFRDDPDLDPVLVCQFFNLYATWKVHTRPSAWAKMLANSSAVVSAWDGGTLVGFARGLSDEVRYAQVLEVLVHPDYRRRGIGSQLLRTLIARPPMQVRGVNLGTPAMRAFYESVGFRCVNDQAYFMVLVRDEFGADLVQPIEA